MKKEKKMPWYSVSLMLSILGSISIVLLFGVVFYNEHGIVFWAIIFAWASIILGFSLEISRLERARLKSVAELSDKLKELEKKIAEKE